MPSNSIYVLEVLFVSKIQNLIFNLKKVTVLVNFLFFFINEFQKNLKITTCAVVKSTQNTID